jgi:CRP/FNR family transcriptional regulator
MYEGNDRFTSALERLFGASLREIAPAGVSPFALVHVVEGAPLVHEGASARCLYLVQAGTFKIMRTGEDGYEQVLGFAGRHDLLGCDGLADGTHRRAVAALEESWVYALPVAEMQRLAQQWPPFAARWQAAMATEIVRAGEMAWIMSAVGADKRTARFISLLAERMAERGESPRRLRLRMGRRDIASHLGLAHESVSRSFSMLAAAGVLRVDNREIEIVDAQALRRFASSTRGYPEAPAARRGPTLAYSRPAAVPAVAAAAA